MGDELYERAPRWREGLAGVVDVSLMGGFALLRSRGVRPVEAAARLRWLRYIPADAVREQIPSPGQLLLGIRTVDRRTGRRVALWRTLLLLGTAAGGQQIARRLSPPPPEPEQRQNRDSYWRTSTR